MSAGSLSFVEFYPDTQSHLLCSVRPPVSLNHCCCYRFTLSATDGSRCRQKIQRSSNGRRSLDPSTSCPLQRSLSWPLANNPDMLGSWYELTCTGNLSSLMQALIIVSPPSSRKRHPCTPFLPHSVSYTCCCCCCCCCSCYVTCGRQRS